LLLAGAEWDCPIQYLHQYAHLPKVEAEWAKWLKEGLKGVNGGQLEK
jgi:hypothetical protein